MVEVVRIENRSLRRLEKQVFGDGVLALKESL